MKALDIEYLFPMNLRFVAALLSLPFVALSAPYTALSDGESFTYRVMWGPFSKAGEIRVQAKRELHEGSPALRIIVTTTSRGVVRTLYRYEDVSEALIDEATGRLIVATEVAHNGEKMIDATTKFDYLSRKLTHTDLVRPGRNTEVRLPEGDPVDLISALIESREWANRVGIKRDALIWAGRDVYPVTIYADASEVVWTPNGEVRALALTPRMEREAPRGIFKRGGEIKVWVAQSGERLPVKMQLKLKFGTASLYLMEHVGGRKIEAEVADGAAKGSVPSS